MTGGEAVWGRAAVALPPLPDPVPAADLYVVGLGGAGLAAVQEGLRRGRRVVGIDRGGVAAGATGRNGGFLLAGRADFFHRTAEAIGREEAKAVHLLTAAEIRRMAAETPAAVRPVGSWRVAASDAEADDLIDHYTALRLAGIGTGVERDETPWGPALRFPDDAAFDPVARAASVASSVLAGGASLFVGEVADVFGLGGPTVVAVDGGLEVVVPALAGRVRTARLQMIATAPTTEVAVPRPVYRRFGFDYFQQLPGGEVAVGGLRDELGDAEWTGEPVPTDAGTAALTALLRDVVGVKEAAVVRSWAGCSAFTTDHRPICETVADGVVAVGGYSGTGNVVGPLCGRAAVQLLFDNSSAIAATLLA